MYKGNLEKQALTGDSDKFVQIFYMTKDKEADM